MKISREAKIGLAGIIALVLLFFTIKFLQGVQLFSTQDTYYINFRNAKALAKSSPVYADGYNVGIVSDLHYDYKGITENDIATDSDYKGKRLSQNNLGFTNYWERKTKMIFTAQKTQSGYDVFYYTQTSPDAQPQFLKYNYANGALTKTSITQSEIDEFKSEWRFIFD